MDEVEAIITYITREATSDIGSLFSAKKEEHPSYAGHEKGYTLFWGARGIGTFLVYENYLYLIMGTKGIPNVDKCPRVDMADPKFDISPILNELRGMVSELDAKLKASVSR